jgi:hypothetical protein
VAAPYFLAAANCDRAADDIIELSKSVYNLESMVASAWKGGSGSSLTNALVDKASLVLYAAGVLRSAAGHLRHAGTQLAKAQYEATERAARRG